MQRGQLLIGLFCVLFYWSCSSSHEGQYSIQKKYAPSLLQEDAQILEKILESNHPSLYWYTPKEKMDSYFNETIHGIQDSLTEVEFRNRIAVLVSQIRCGHTIVRYSNQFVKS
ncbi:MAG: peptidase S41, partial [Bacteroidota bacterium]